MLKSDCCNEPMTEEDADWGICPMCNEPCDTYWVEDEDEDEE